VVRARLCGDKDAAVIDLVEEPNQRGTGAATAKLVRLTGRLGTHDGRSST
jgi:hypothetical protein